MKYSQTFIYILIKFVRTCSIYRHIYILRYFLRRD